MSPSSSVRRATCWSSRRHPSDAGYFGDLLANPWRPGGQGADHRCRLPRHPDLTEMGFGLVQLRVRQGTVKETLGSVNVPSSAPARASIRAI